MYLEPGDWQVIGFYCRVRDQYDNLTPMGVEKGKPMALYPRIESYRAALELYGYPRTSWAWLTDGALLLHRLLHKLEHINWYAEFGKPLSQLSAGDFR
jgi:hypothetical protein